MHTLKDSVPTRLTPMISNKQIRRSFLPSIPNGYTPLTRRVQVAAYVDWEHYTTNPYPGKPVTFMFLGSPMEDTEFVYCWTDAYVTADNRGNLTFGRTTDKVGTCMRAETWPWDIAAP